MEAINASKLRSQFLYLLRTRRSAQGTWYIHEWSGEQGCLPVLILSMKESSHHRRPAVVFLHGNNKCKEWLRPLLEAYASRGYVAVAIDSRYHGDRASSMTTYREVLLYHHGEKGIQCHSYLIRNSMDYLSILQVWDLIKLADYLTQREDIDPSKIGITGESLGGMHAWFAAAADTCYAVAVPIIGVQLVLLTVMEYFSVHALCYRDFDGLLIMISGRVGLTALRMYFKVRPRKLYQKIEDSWYLTREARVDLGKRVIDKEVVENVSCIYHRVWDRIAPGLASQFDSPYTIPIIAPRPLLILNGEKDPRCPLEGLEIPKSRARKAYEEAHCPDKFKLIAQPGIGHELTKFMVKEASDWFDRFLK
ncbi:hypothetical protein RHGRI_005333 [Rhododendron griersonianum]|uniref:AB hydrolase-1 domain-containing protein n=1 Tax=Rhododendron griersonianum TaxID=479676 RepID=A0AAV6LCW9_9ERIC|nr:hypothetical protein RHGRI_005333 [Rhododendron griersonianum]